MDTTSITGLGGAGKWASGVLAGDGKIYASPFDASSVLIIDPATNTADTTSIAGLPAQGTKWYDAALGPDGRVYMLPFSAEAVLTIGKPCHVVTGLGD